MGRKRHHQSSRAKQQWPSESEVTLRELTQADVSECVTIEESVYPDERWDSSEFERHFDRATIKTAAIDTSGSIIGYMICAQGEHSLELENIAVTRSGVGTILIKTILDQPCITLRVRNDNQNAIRFYQKCDFDFLDGPASDSAVWMIRDVNYLPVRNLSDSNYEYVLQLIVQFGDTMWSWGTAFLIADRLAVTAKHLYTNIYTEMLRRRDAQYGGVAPFQMDAHQHFGLNNNFRRWAIKKVIPVQPLSVDLLLLELEPHPKCPYACKYELHRDRYPQLRMFPPAMGDQVMALGYPEDENKGKLTKIRKTKDGRTHLLNNPWMWRSLGAAEVIRPGQDVDPLSDKAPTFITNLRTRSGMSGGPVFKKVADGWQICGVVSTTIGGGILRASTLSPLLDAWIPVESVLHSFETVARANRLFRIARATIGPFGEPQIICPVKGLAELGHLNVPDIPIFSLKTAILTELREKGTLMGSPEWEVTRVLDLSGELRRFARFNVAHTVYMQNQTLATDVLAAIHLALATAAVRKWLHRTDPGLT